MEGRAKSRQVELADRGLFLEETLVVKSDREGSGHCAATEGEGKLEEEHARPASICFSAVRAGIESEYWARA